MQILIHSDVAKDIKKKRKTFPGLGKQLKYIYRAMAVDGSLSWEEPLQHMGDLGNKAFHARIALPKHNISKKKGPRIIYLKDVYSVSVICIGAHGEKIYDDGQALEQLIRSRMKVEEFTLWEDKD